MLFRAAARLTRDTTLGAATSSHRATRPRVAPRLARVKTRPELRQARGEQRGAPQLQRSTTRPQAAPWLPRTTAAASSRPRAAASLQRATRPELLLGSRERRRRHTATTLLPRPAPHRDDTVTETSETARRRRPRAVPTRRVPSTPRGVTWRRLAPPTVREPSEAPGSRLAPENRQRRSPATYSSKSNT